MNIDMKKLERLIGRGGEYSFNVISVVKECEIKRKCFDCGEKQGVYNLTCKSCVHSPNLSDNSIPKQNELDKLFIGAPVVLNSWNNAVRINYYDGVSKANIDRLPTVEEAPRNVWLAPWLNEPTELYDDNGYCRIKLRKKGSSAIWDLYELEWSQVEAVMILEDFKK